MLIRMDINKTRMSSAAVKTVLGVVVTLALILVGVCQNVEATKCKPGPQSKFVGLKASIKQVKNYHENPRDKFTISGTVEIVDGCKFVVKNFTFPSGLPATWYGKDQNAVEGYRLIQGVIAPSSGEDKIFTLSDTPGNSYDWNDFDTLTIFHKDNVYAEAHFSELEQDSPFLSSNKPFGGSHTPPNSNASLSQTTNDKKMPNGSEGVKKMPQDKTSPAPSDNHNHGSHEESGSMMSGSKESGAGKSAQEGGSKKETPSGSTRKAYYGFFQDPLASILAIVALTVFVGGGLSTL